MSDHDHVHGHGEGQHVHEGWEPSRVIARLKRDGFCAQVSDTGVCMRQASDSHSHEEA